MGDTSGTTTVRETERKYESDGPLDTGLVAELATAIAGAPDRDAPTPTEFALSATYYDTADLRLARSGADPAPSPRRQRRRLAPQAARRDGQP